MSQPPPPFESSSGELSLEELFRASFEQAAVGMCHTSLDGAFLRVNRRFCELTGYTPDELLAISFRELTHPDDRAADEALGRRLLAGEIATYSLEKRYLHKNGVVIWVNLTVTSMRGSTSAINQLLSVVEEITDRKLAEWALRKLNATLEERVAERTAALTLVNERLHSEIMVRERAEQAQHESEQQYRLLIESLNQGVVVFQDERIVFCNQFLADLLGYTLADLLALTPAQMWHMIFADERQRVADNVNEALSSGTLSTEVPFRITRGDGSRRWLHGPSRVISYAGRPAFLSVVSDITDLKEAEEALRLSRDELRAANVELARAARLKDEFLANMSHELRTPLNAVLGRAELLREEVHGPLSERQLRSVVSIEESGRHLLALINDILDLSKIEANKLELQAEPISVADLCHSSLRLVTETAQKKYIELSTDLDPQVGIIEGDPRRLKQILLNLLSNAVKFTPSGGKVGLEVRGNSAAGSIAFTVWDTGIGIAGADLPRLFRPFEQLDSSLSRQYEGTGLGLSLVARLAWLHGGSVAVASDPGRGSRFTVTLPWATYERTTPPSSP